MKIKRTALLTCTLLLLASPAMAGYGGGNRSIASNNALISMVDGCFAKFYFPPASEGAGIKGVYVTNGNYVTSLTGVYFGSESSFNYNGAGYIKYRDINGVTTQKGVYEIKNAFGDTIYFSPEYTNFSDNVEVSAGLWRVTGSQWHFNWWGPDYNYGYDTSDTGGGIDPYESSVATYTTSSATIVDGSGIGVTGDIWRSSTTANGKTQGSWYTFPTMQLYTWGSTSPSWNVLGNAGSGGGVTFKYPY